MEAKELAVRISIPPFSIKGTVKLPEQPLGVVLLARGSGASRPGRHDRFVIEELCEAGLGTAVLDLITPAEGEVDEDTHLLWFDIHLLAGRLVIATDWLRQRIETRDLPLGYLGAGAGAAVALAAASERSSAVRAIVSRDGRPDLIEPALPSVVTPTLLIVTGGNRECLTVNQHAMETLAARDKELWAVARPKRLVEARSALDEPARLARDWFVRYLPPHPDRPADEHQDPRGSLLRGSVLEKAAAMGTAPAGSDR